METLKRGNKLTNMEQYMAPNHMHGYANFESGNKLINVKQLFGLSFLDYAARKSNTLQL